jgi:hypothetical protein
VSGHIDYTRIIEVHETDGEGCNRMLREGWTLIDVKSGESDTLYSRTPMTTIRRMHVVYVMGRLSS